MMCAKELLNLIDNGVTLLTLISQHSTGLILREGAGNGKEIRKISQFKVHSNAQV